MAVAIVYSSSSNARRLLAPPASGTMMKFLRHAQHITLRGYSGQGHMNAVEIEEAFGSR
jgi:hypothetical protein